MKKIKSFFYGILCRFGYKQPLPEFIAQHIEFMELFNEIKFRALLGIERAFFLFQFAGHASNFLQGEIAEVGVYKGGGAKIIAEAVKNPNKTIHLFDTFSGHPKTNKKEDSEYQKKGLYKDTSLEEVKNFLSEFNKIKFYKGVFPETTKPVLQKKFCFVHIDTDLYESTKASIEFFYFRMVSGGIIIVDDYGNPDAKGVKKSVDEFFRDKKEFPILCTQHQCIIIKL